MCGCAAVPVCSTSCESHACTTQSDGEHTVTYDTVQACRTQHLCRLCRTLMTMTATITNAVDTIAQRFHHLTSTPSQSPCSKHTLRHTPPHPSPPSAAPLYKPNLCEGTEYTKYEWRYRRGRSAAMWIRQAPTSTHRPHHQDKQYCQQ